MESPAFFAMLGTIPSVLVYEEQTKKYIQPIPSEEYMHDIYLSSPTGKKRTM
jgi:hypothetical protein